MDIAVYDKDSDRDACHRIWEEVGWLDRSNEKQVAGVDTLISAGRALVGKLNGEAECLVLAARGSMRYLDEDISFSGVTGVTTSSIVRRQGFAAQMTARLIAEEAEDGAALSGLGMFEQGFYNRLGYGTGSYDLSVSFDPQSLNVPFPSRSPQRLSIDDWKAMHASRLARKREHGYVTFDAPEMTQMDDIGITAGRGFGLGFRDGANGELTHHVWFRIRSNENGPYKINWIAYQTPGQFLELMGVIRTLGDQVRLVTLVEPAGIQLQDLLDQPIQTRMITRGSKFESTIRALAWWQIRICDLNACLNATRLPSDELRFNLNLSDPIERFLDTSTSWNGIGGEYVVSLGASSGAERGKDPSLPTLKTTVPALSRLWLGVRPATGLAITDDLEAPPELLEALDLSLRLPTPVRDWEF